jgi:DNA-binding NtrC family response regulator
LLVEDNPHDAQYVSELLAELGKANYAMEHVTTLADGVGIVARGNMDLALLDLSLPDSERGNTVPAFMVACPPQTAVVVVSGAEDEELAALSVQQGAQDYLVKGHFSAFVLGRVMRYAVERHRLQRELREKQQQELAALKALVPFCAYCGRVRDRADNTYHSPEEYLAHYAEIDATHGICPDCRHELAAKMVEENGSLDEGARRRAAKGLRGSVGE